MKKYYPAKEVKFIERNEVIDKLKDADNTPTKHIRIIFNDKKKKISFYNDEEYDILQAVVFLWTRNSLLRYDFDADEEAGKHLCIATRPDEYMAIALKDGESIAEGLSQFEDNDRILAMIHVEEETFFIAYDGNASRVGYGYFAEEEDRPSIFDNLLGDLHGEKYLELSAPWWFQATNEELQIVGKLPLAAGSFGLTNYAWANVVFFSKELAKDYQVEDLYTIVQNGDWTLDRMFSIASTVRKDLNGDNIYDEHDVLGILSSYDYMAFLADSMGCVYTTKNEDGTVTYNPLSEKLVAINEKLFSVMSGSGESGIGYADSYALKNKYGTPDNYSKMIETFAADQSMFMVHRLEHTDSEAMRNMDGYGIIPAPKYDTEQKNYITATVPELAGIPSVVTDREVSAILLEALQYESWKTVRPAYYDIALKAKYSQDSVTGQMLDLIFENVTCSFAYMFNQVTGGYPSSELGRTQNYASWYTQNSKVWQKKLNIAVKNLQEAE